MSLGVGVIGAGVMGSEHARLVREETSGAQLVAVCDADPARAGAAASGTRVFEDAQALIAAPEVEAVVIASPDATHAEYALACLAAGKPVLCEKPIAATAAEGMKIVEAELSLGRRLVQVGFMRRFDAAYREMRRTLASGRIGEAVLLHNIHRNLAAPDWFTGAMTVTNSFVHEIDISRWLLGSEMTSAQVFPAGAAGLLMIVMRTAKDEVVSTEVNINGGYGYHVHAPLVGTKGTMEMAAPARTLTNVAGAHGFGFPRDWIPRFAQAYRDQMQAWVNAAREGLAVGASAWDGYVTSAVAERIVAVMDKGDAARIALPEPPPLYLGA
jgi:myo-inositol 2-dehydrogenase/D-chiro-inositol 1-dehydrogenase